MKPLPSERLHSLDVFRGMTIAGMILVNNPGGGRTFPQLLHAEWHGCTFTDLIFPFFLFIVGVAIPYALGKGERGQLLGKVARRVAILFALGLFLNWFRLSAIDWSVARIPGVLQRIAIVFGLAALAFLYLGKRGRLVLTAVLLAGYWLLLAGGDLSPQSNLAAVVDHAVLGNHTWRLAPGPGDPEGILSTLGALATALLGVFAGEWLRTSQAMAEKLAGLFFWGSLGMAAGWALSGLLPWNKNLWTPTYVLWTGGLAAVVLAVTLELVDVRGYRAWAKPFEIFGTNAIFAFAGSTLLAKLGYQIKWLDGAGQSVTLQSFVFRSTFEPWLPERFASLAYASSYLLLWLGLTWLLYRRRWFLRV